MALSAALKGEADAERLALEAGAEPEALRELAALLRAPRGENEQGDGERRTPEVVILWGERLAAGPNGEAGVRALLEIAEALGMADTGGAGLLEIPATSNGRGLREAGVLPNAGPGLSEPARVGRDARAIAEALAEGELAAVYLLRSDPLRDLPDGELWERALAGASTVIAHAAFLTEGIREHATVVFPAEAYPEKEGTIVHPDGRVQRLRPAIARPGCGARRVAGARRAGGLRSALDLDVLTAVDGLAAPVRGGALLRGPARSRRSAVAACAGRSARPLRASPPPAPARDRTPRARVWPRRPRTRSSSPASARCGTRPRSSTRRRSSSCSPGQRLYCHCHTAAARRHDHPAPDVPRREPCITIAIRSRR